MKAIEEIKDITGVPLFLIKGELPKMLFVVHYSPDDNINIVSYLDMGFIASRLGKDGWKQLKKQLDLS